MKKLILTATTFIVIMIFSIAGISAYMIKADDSSNKKVIQKVEEFTKIKLDDAVVIKNDNKGKGWFGDGVKTVVIKFDNKDFKNNVSRNRDMKKLPFSTNLQKIFYRNSTGESSAVLENDEGRELLPKVKNGYYMIINRRDGKEEIGDSNIFKGYSYDFTVLLFDEDTNELYYVEYDS